MAGIERDETWAICTMSSPLTRCRSDAPGQPIVVVEDRPVLVLMAPTWLRHPPPPLFPPRPYRTLPRNPCPLIRVRRALGAGTEAARIAAVRDTESIEQLVAASPLAAVVTNPRKPDNPIAAVNSAFCALTGYSRQEIIGRNCRFLAGPETEPWGTEELRLAMITWIEKFYHRRRRQRALGKLTPIEFELLHDQLATAA